MNFGWFFSWCLKRWERTFLQVSLLVSSYKRFTRNLAAKLRTGRESEFVERGREREREKREGEEREFFSLYGITEYLTYLMMLLNDYLLLFCSRRGMLMTPEQRAWSAQRNDVSAQLRPLQNLRRLRPNPERQTKPCCKRCVECRLFVFNLTEPSLSEWTVTRWKLGFEVRERILFFIIPYD